MAKVLLYHLEAETEKGKKLRAALGNVGLKAVDVSEAQLNKTVRALADRRPGTAEPYTGEPYPIEFLLLCGGGEGMLDRMLAAMRRASVSVAHKAVLTGTNQNWPMHRLLEEVMREHAALGGLPRP